MTSKPMLCTILMKIFVILLFLWTAKSYGLSCTASPTNKDPTVITRCYAKLLTHFEQILKEQLAFNYANHLKKSYKLNDATFRKKYYSNLFIELERVQKLKHTLNYPDPRPAVRCEAPSNGQ